MRAGDAAFVVSSEQHSELGGARDRERWPSASAGAAPPRGTLVPSPPHRYFLSRQTPHQGVPLVAAPRTYSSPGSSNPATIRCYRSTRTAYQAPAATWCNHAASPQQGHSRHGELSVSRSIQPVTCGYGRQLPDSFGPTRRDGRVVGRMSPKHKKHKSAGGRFLSPRFSRRSNLERRGGRTDWPRQKALAATALVCRNSPRPPQMRES